MYAVIKTGGKQYLVREKDKIFAEKIEAAEGSTVDFTPIMMSDNGAVMTGEACAAAKVVCRVKEHYKAKKIVIHHYRRRKDSDVTKGHRQKMVTLIVESITK